MIKRGLKAWTNFIDLELTIYPLLQTFFLIILSLILALLASLVQLAVGFNEQAPDVYDWVKEVYYLGKRSQILFFMISIPMIFVFVTGFKLLIADRFLLRFAIMKVKVSVLFQFFLFGFIALATSYILSNQIFFLCDYSTALTLVLAQIGIIVFTLMVFLKFLFQGTNYALAIYKATSSGTRLMWICLSTMLLLLCSIYYPIATNNLPYLNEYLNIPSSLSKPIFGMTNSIDVINSMSKAGLHIRNMTEPAGPVKRPTLSVLEKNRDSAVVFAHDNKDLYYFDFFSNALVAMATIPIFDSASLQTVTGASPEDVTKFIEYTNEREKLKLAPVSIAETTALEHLRFNLHWQILSRWYFHHHNFFWGPALKLGAGMELKSIFFQYGLVGGVLQYSVVKYLMGEFQIPNYFFFWSIIFVLYFVVFHLGIFSITGSKPLTIFSSIFFLSFLLSQQYEYIFLGPGLNPIRHFFDIPAFFLVNRFFVTKSRSAFLGFILFSLINFIFNPEFGVFCSVALLFSVAVYLWVHNLRNCFFVSVGIASVICHLFLWAVLKTGQDVAVSLYLGGYFSPVYIRVRLFAFFLFIAALGTLLMVRPPSLRKLAPDGFMFLAALLYVALLFIYPLFGVSWNHVVNISPIIIFAGIIGIGYVLTQFSKFRKPILVCLTGTSILFFMSSAKNFLKTKATYQNELKKYEVVRWQLKNNLILTQIPEKPIKASISLIEKYANRERQIAMISRFDNILSIVSEKAMSLPGHELIGFLFSKFEYQMVISAIEQQKPAILFTDRDILISSVDELIDHNTPSLGYLHSESKMRLERVNRLKALFGEIRASYKKIDEGGLLIVWKRI